jgi:Beta-galactosidase
MFGAVFDGIASTANAATRARQFRLMRRSGVQSVRVIVPWSAFEPVPGYHPFGALDQTIRAAAQNRLGLLPVVVYTPQWASSAPVGLPDFRRELYPPANVDNYGRFLRVLIRRYGPRGSFWAENPRLPKRPLREYQIWNEPSARYFWEPRDYARSYPRLLRAAYRAVHRTDRRAKVVTAGLASFSQTGPNWRDLERFYRNGARRQFDVVAIHPFSARLGRVVEIIRRNRRVMRRYGDSRKPIYLTELSFLASKGKIRRSDYLGLEVSARQQRRLLVAAYRRFIRDRRLRVKKGYWYTWASVYTRDACRGNEPSFQYTGLMRVRPCTPVGLTVPLTFRRTRLLSTYRGVARRYGR